MADLVVRISGDVQDYKNKLKEAESETSSLGDGLESIGKASALALAAVAAEAFAATTAFAESQQASNRLTQSLQQQGIYSKALADGYKEIAAAVQEKTGADDDQVISGMTSLQNMIGQTKITQELANAVSDLAVGKLGGDLKGAYDLVGKAATGNMGALQRYGIQIEDTGDRAQNLAKITEALSAKFGGQAEAAAAGLGGMGRLKAMFGDMQEEIGQRLAPAIETLIGGLTNFFRWMKDSPKILDFAVAVGTAVGVVSTLGVIVVAGGLAFLKLKAALVAAEVATSAMTIATRGLVGATGLGLLVIIGTEIFLNWQSIWPRMQATFVAFTSNISNLAGGLGQILKGVFTFDTEAISAGMQRVKTAFSAGLSDYNQIVKQKLDEQAALEDQAEKEKIEKNDAGAAAREAKERAHAQLIQEINREKHNLLVMQADQASKEQLALQQQEIALLEQMEDQKNAAIVGKLRQRLDEVRRLQEEQTVKEREQRAILQNELLTNNAEFEALSDEQKAAFLLKNQTAMQAEILTEKTAREQAAQDRLKTQIQEHNTFLQNQQKFGTAYAMINKIMHSEIFKGTQQAFGDMAALQQSNNSTLKGIGKAAALANIIIQTAQSAMNIYSGFSTIPIIGPALGVAGAAAAVAFGAEQANKVTAAADGGLLTGGIAGRDSIPVLGMPGELVVPTRNFEEVVNSVALARSGAIGGSEGGSISLVLTLKDGLMDMIEANLVSRQNLNLSIQGA